MAVIVLQRGAAREHPELLVQPVRHANVWGSQMGACCGQSEFARQATHVLLRLLQRGTSAGQSESVAHGTHC